MELATWVLAVFTCVLAVSTSFYTYETIRLARASKDQSDALDNLTKAIRDLPQIAESIERQRSNERKLAEEKQKAKQEAQKKATTGH